MSRASKQAVDGTLLLLALQAQHAVGRTDQLSRGAAAVAVADGLDGTSIPQIDLP
jgi:hypothetical protein